MTSMQMAKCLECLPKLFFPEGMGVYIKLVETQEGLGGGGLHLCSKYGNSREEGGGTCMKFLLWWRCGYFLELHNIISVSIIS